MLSESKYENLVCLTIMAIIFSNFLGFLLICCIRIEKLSGYCFLKEPQNAGKGSLNGMKKHHPIWSKFSLSLSLSLSLILLMADFSLPDRKELKVPLGLELKYAKSTSALVSAVRFRTLQALCSTFFFFLLIIS